MLVVTAWWSSGSTSSNGLPIPKTSPNTPHITLTSAPTFWGNAKRESHGNTQKAMWAEEGGLFFGSNASACRACKNEGQEGSSGVDQRAAGGGVIIAIQFGRIDDTGRQEEASRWATASPGLSPSPSSPSSPSFCRRRLRHHRFVAVVVAIVVVVVTLLLSSSSSSSFCHRHRRRRHHFVAVAFVVINGPSLPLNPLANDPPPLPSPTNGDAGSDGDGDKDDDVYFPNEGDRIEMYCSPWLTTAEKLAKPWSEFVFIRRELEENQDGDMEWCCFLQPMIGEESTGDPEMECFLTDLKWAYLYPCEACECQTQGKKSCKVCGLRRPLESDPEYAH